MTVALILLTGVVIYLLLRYEFDRRLKVQFSRSNRSAVSHRRGVAKQIGRHDEVIEKITEVAEAASRKATLALAAAEDMSKRFDRGEKPDDTRLPHSLSEIRRRSEDRVVNRIKEKAQAAVVRQ